MAMDFVRTKSTAWMIGCAVALIASGCHAPWFVRPETARNHPREASRAVVAPSSTTGPQPTSSEQELAAVLDELQDLGGLDPAGQQRLIAELRRTKPELWPLVTQQFRATLAYHQELASRQESAGSKEIVAPSPSLSATSSPGRLHDSHRGSPSIDDERASEEISTRIESGNLHRELPANGPQATAYPIVAIDDAAESAAPYGEAAYLDPASQGLLQANFEAARQPQLVEPRVLPATAAGEDAARHVPGRVSSDWREHLEQAAADLSRRVADSPQTTAEIHQHATLRILRLLAGETEAALEPIPHISPVEQDYWSRQLFALATYLDHHKQPDEKRRAAASVTHLDEAVTKLRELGSLSLRNLTFCKQVYGFGAYEPYNTDRFSAGQQVSIYVEVENYCSRSTKAGYCTLLGATYEILNERDERVDGGAFPDVEDCCRSRRRDFHIQYGLVLPQRLASGRYRLQLVVKDRQSDKQGSASLAFEVGGM